MFHTVFIGPYLSNSMAGIVFRGFVKSLGTPIGTSSFSVLSYPDLTVPVYAPTPVEEMLLLNLSASKEAYTNLGGPQTVAVVFSDSPYMESLFEQLFSSGITVGALVLCSPIDLTENGQLVEKLQEIGVELLPLNEAGTVGLGTLWNPQYPIMPAKSNIVSDTDIVLFDRTFATLKTYATQLSANKTLYVYDPFSYLSLSGHHGPTKELHKLLRDKKSEMKSFTYHTTSQLLTLVDDKSVAIGSVDMGLVLGALVEDPTRVAQRSTVMFQDLRAILLAKYKSIAPISIEEAVKQAQQDVPPIPQGLKKEAVNA